ncbi:MAG: type II 3-dehydroquinate dehydratase [Alphaproteobacteria bacterium]|nr:type II 3-dehydroquinate dehydratase [Alphaproteobacteria bacterium]
MVKRIHILNGPNLNLLGTREADIYGTLTLADIESLCREDCVRLGIEMSFAQTNSEGELVTLIQAAGAAGAGLVINAGAYTHTSIAVHDAIRAARVVAVEVHLSNVYAREDFRHHSYISPVARGVICGFGATGYRLAISALAEELD